jgi:hypothetical protein
VNNSGATLCRLLPATVNAGIFSVRTSTCLSIKDEGGIENALQIIRQALKLATNT